MSSRFTTSGFWASSSGKKSERVMAEVARDPLIVPLIGSISREFLETNRLLA